MRGTFHYSTATVQEILERWKNAKANTASHARNKYRDNLEISAKLEEAYKLYRAAGERRLLYVGYEIVSSDGHKLKLVHIDNKSIVLEDENGVRKSRNRSYLDKKIIWNFESNKRGFSAGEKVVLKCGVEVEVVKYLERDASNITYLEVKDSLGNCKKVSSGKLSIKKVAWNFPHPDNALYIFQVGHTFETACGIKVRVVEHLKDFKYVLEDEIGVRRVRMKQGIPSAGLLTWSVSKESKAPRGHYVYVAHIDGKPYYIGYGKGNRYRHIISGTSSSYLANKHYFTEDVKLDVMIHTEGLTEKEAAALELKLIEEFTPPYNLKDNPAKVHPNRRRYKDHTPPASYLVYENDPGILRPWSGLDRVSVMQNESQHHSPSTLPHTQSPVHTAAIP